MTAKHTPGPWHVGEVSPYTGGLEIRGPEGSGAIVARAAMFGPQSITPFAQEPNARLIAAAPDLLEALQDVAEFWEQIACTNDLYAKARAAIAKATGD